MIGLSALESAKKSGASIQRFWLYVDASPLSFRRGGQKLGVCISMPKDEPEHFAFHVANGSIVHVNGGNEKRVRAFAERISKYRPKMIVLNWHEAMEIWE